MSRSSVAREPQGTPTGGRFAAAQKAEAHGVQLPASGEADFSAAMDVTSMMQTGLTGFGDGLLRPAPVAE